MNKHILQGSRRMIGIKYDIYDIDNSIDTFIKKRHMIPYAIESTDTRLQTNKNYYIGYHRMVMNVKNVEYAEDGSLDWCYVKWSDGFYGNFCSNLDLYADYIMEYDDDGIYKEVDIVNKDTIYTGAEIKYWFYINDITVLNHRYAGFMSFFDPKSKHKINPYLKYRLVADIDEDGSYINCKMIKIITNKIIVK